MEIQGLLTKFALLFSGIAFYNVGMLSGFMAFLLVVVTVVASTMRDIGLLSRNIQRKLPSFGIVWLIAMFLAVPFISGLEAVVESEFMDFAGITTMCSLVSLGVRGLCIPIEGGVELLFSTVLDPWISRAFGEQQYQPQQSYPEQYSQPQQYTHYSEEPPILPVEQRIGYEPPVAVRPANVVPVNPRHS